MGVLQGAATGATIGSVVPGVGTVVGAGVGALASAIGGWLKHKGDKKKAEEARRAMIAHLELQNNMREDQRIAGVNTGASLLGGIGQADAYGGRIKPNMALDPNLVAQLQARRKYDFSKAVPDTSKGAGTAFLGGLFEDVGDAALNYRGGPSMPAGGPPMGMVGSGQDGGSALTMEDLLKNIGPKYGQ